MTRPPAPKPWHAMEPEEVLAALEVDPAVGPTAADHRARRERYGANELPGPRPRSRLVVFVRQMKSPLIYLLFVAAGIALAMGNLTDAAVVLVVVLFNAVIGAFQEGRAERSLAALRQLTTKTARVLRDGHELVVEARDLVPGDILVIEAGDAAAADARLLRAEGLRVNEAILTGESVAVSKATAAVAPDASLGDRLDMVFAGTHVVAGRGRAIVVATAFATEIGQIAALTAKATEPKTPLERRIEQFGRSIAVIATILFVAITGIGWLQGRPFGEIVMIAISQLVGMIPEGLPVAMTVALAVGVQRMARRHAIVRRLAAVETLGSTTVICSDKTGTLTRNEMTVTTLWLPDGRELEVTGVGYEPVGTFHGHAAPLDHAAIRELLEAIVLCNDAELEGSDEGWQPIGDPTEVALLVIARKAGLVPRAIRERFPRRAEIPFDSKAKVMVTEHERPPGTCLVIKGAPEAVFELCHHDQPRTEMQRAADRLAARALRVLAVAVIDDAKLGAGLAELRGRARLLGLVGEIDPPRPEVADAVVRCRQAGIRPVVVTGDHKETGFAIARTLGIANDGDRAVDGRELERMTDEELAARIDEISVFARVQPAQKVRIVDAYQRRGDVVAMTGDGVNDAPALAKADVGVAMGSGTEVAKEASKIVITDDNFATIVSAVEEGRVVYRNIKKALLLLFSTSIAEVTVLLLALLLGYPAPFAAVQILWNNLVTEGLITVNLVLEPPEGDEMQLPPVPAREPLLTRLLLTRVAFMVPAIVASTLGWFIFRTSAGVPTIQVQTETFTLLAICEWYNVLNCRSATKTALSLSVLRNRWLIGGLVAGNLLQIAVVFWQPLGSVMRTVPFSTSVVVELGLVGSLVLWVEEVRKLFVRRRLRARAALARS